LLQLSQFDYDISDLSNVLPNLGNNYYPYDEVNVGVEYSTAPTVSIDYNGGALVGSFVVLLNFYLPNNNNTSLLTFEVTINASVEVAFNGGVLDFVVNTATYNPSSINITSGQTLTVIQEKYLNFYLSNALQQFKGLPLVYGSNFNVYGASLSNPTLQCSNGFLYLLD